VRGEEGWTDVAESGGARALRWGGRLARALGRRNTSRLMWPVAAYFLLRRRSARRGSRQFLERVASRAEGRAALGGGPGWGASLRHLHAFGMSLYDRMRVWSGGLEGLEVQHDGSEAIFESARSGRGALLLGAHLGSLDLLSFLSRHYDLVVNVVAFFENARRVNEFFASLGPGHRLRLIELDPDSVQAALSVRACIGRGELVAVMADRLAPGGHGRSALCTFLGRPARFPLGPFLLAGVLECPVLFTLCVCIAPGRYETVLRPLGRPEGATRHEREKQARELLETYVAELEARCLRHPFQWFNLYEFWTHAGDPA